MLSRFLKWLRPCHYSTFSQVPSSTLDEFLVPAYHTCTKCGQRGVDYVFPEELNQGKYVEAKAPHA